MAEVKNPNAGESSTPPDSEEQAPSTTEDRASDIATANTPDPNAANPEANANAAAEPKAKKPAAAKPAGDKPADKAAAKPAEDKPGGKAGAKKEKAPALEDKPFADFINQDYLPALKTALTKQGLKDIDLTLALEKFPISGLGITADCWQVIGRWQQGQRQFHVYFPKEDIQGQRAFAWADRGSKPSTLEPFLIDERKITLDLLVFGVVQRLNAQKWLTRN